MDADEETSPLLFDGGPRGGNSGSCRIGVTAFELGLELLPERGPDDVLEFELRDLSRCAVVLDLFTTLNDGRELCEFVAVALVNVNVKYCVSSILQVVMMHVACRASEWDGFFSASKAPSVVSAFGAINTST
jgi:hypothetical protein